MGLVKRAFSFGLPVCFGLLLGSCAEKAGSGAPVKIPSVVIDCTTANCKGAGHAVERGFVYITTTNCDANFYLAATAVSSVDFGTTTACNPTSGCHGNLVSWYSGADNQPTTTIPSGTYTVCGRIDFDGTFPAGSGTHDTLIEMDNVSFTSNMGIISLGGAGGSLPWQDH